METDLWVAGGEIRSFARISKNVEKTNFLTINLPTAVRRADDFAITTQFQYFVF